MKKIVILFSGEGSNMQNLIQQLHPHQVEVLATITNNPNAKGIQRSEKLGIKTIIIDHREFKTRTSFDTKLVETIDTLNPDLTILAGFMRILTPIFTNKIKAINIHPSLLPLFKGANALERSYQSDMKVAGVTVHEVVTEVDGGKIIAQRCFEKMEMDLKTFEKRVHEVEHDLFPEAVMQYLHQLNS